MELLRVPQINANEDELEVTDVYVEEGQRVKKGELICCLESTKASVDLEAPCDGFVRQLDVAVEDRAKVGALICAITATADEPVELGENKGEAKKGALDKDQPRSTRRAAALATEYEIDLRKVEHKGIVTERDVLSFLEKTAGDLRAPGDSLKASLRANGPRRETIVIYGAGGHARVVIDALREGRRDLQIVGLVDDGDDVPDEVAGVPVLGDSSVFSTLREQGVRHAALGIGAVTHNALRAELFERLLRLGFELPNIIHPRAAVEPSAVMGRGNQIFAGAVVSSNVTLGDNTIINSNTVVSHDCVVGDHVHLTPGALLAGNVSVGPRSVVGMGVTVYLGVAIGRDVMVANGTHILQDVADETVLRASDVTRR